MIDEVGNGLAKGAGKPGAGLLDDHDAIVLWQERGCLYGFGGQMPRVIEFTGGSEPARPSRTQAHRQLVARAETPPGGFEIESQIAVDGYRSVPLHNVMYAQIKPLSAIRARIHAPQPAVKGMPAVFRQG